MTFRIYWLRKYFLNVSEEQTRTLQNFHEIKIERISFRLPPRRINDLLKFKILKRRLKNVTFILNQECSLKFENDNLR